MEEILLYIKEIFQYMQENIWARKLIVSGLGLILAILLINMINRALYSKIGETNRFYMARKRTYYIVTILYIVLMFFVWFELAGAFTTYAGLLSAGIAIALKDLFSNMAAWLFIMFKRPFSVGDRILINGKRGDVIDVRIFQFSLIELNEPADGEQSTGRMVDIPNHYVFLYPVVNYVKGFKYIWNEIKIEITFESDWKKMKKELEKIVDRHTLHFTGNAEKEIRAAARKYMIYFNNLTPIVYTDVRSSGVQLTLRYLCEPKTKRQTVNDIWEDILKVIAQNDDINLAYPTHRIVRT